MKVFKFLTIGLALIGTTTLTSCKKEGCIDSDGINYDSDAKKDDGSCTYSGELVFWIDEETSDNLQNSLSSDLSFYIDDKLVGTAPTSVYWSAAPACGANNTVTVTKELGEAKSRTFTYRIDNQVGVTLKSGVVNFTANNCEKFEFEN